MKHGVGNTTNYSFVHKANQACRQWLVSVSLTKPTVTCLKLTMEALEKGVKYVQSWCLYC